MHTRPYQDEDAARTREIYERAVHRSGAMHYNPEQLNAWAPLDLSPAELDAWGQKRAAARTILAVENDLVAGFSDLVDETLLDMLFVDPMFGRRGVGSMLISAVIGLAKGIGAPYVETHASLVASRSRTSECASLSLKSQPAEPKGLLSKDVTSPSLHPSSIDKVSASCRTLHRFRCGYDAGVRTTVDLPPAVHRRARDLAQQRHQSLSAVVADLAIRGLATLGEPVMVAVDPTSGFPVISIGRSISSADVAEALDDE